jgi:hypothetical protein
MSGLSLKVSLGLTQSRPPSGEGGGGDYVAGAVTFDPNSADPTILYRPTAMTGVSDGLLFSFSVWVKSRAPQEGQFIFSQWDIAEDFNDYCDLGTSGFTSTTCRYMAETISEDLEGGLSIRTADEVVLLETWQHVCGMIDNGNDIARIWVDDVEKSQTKAGNGATIVFDQTWGLPAPPYVLADGGGQPGLDSDLADIWIAPGVFLDFSVEANRRLFISAEGKPVNPSGWPTSAIQFYGDADNFATNRGTGGAFTLTGPLVNAATSPSG